jgi:hypothetical protein
MRRRWRSNQSVSQAVHCHRRSFRKHSWASPGTHELRMEFPSLGAGLLLLADWCSSPAHTATLLLLRSEFRFQGRRTTRASTKLKDVWDEYPTASAVATVFLAPFTGKHPGGTACHLTVALAAVVHPAWVQRPRACVCMRASFERDCYILRLLHCSFEHHNLVRFRGAIAVKVKLSVETAR